MAVVKNAGFFICSPPLARKAVYTSGDVKYLLRSVVEQN
jgi:hypothetical protein